MDKTILQSIVEITKQRDLDSLEYSLVATLAELVPAISIFILKAVKENNIDCAEEIARLYINKENDEPFSWGVDPTIIKPDEHFRNCLKNHGPISFIHDDGFTRHQFPIFEEGRVIGCLIVDTTEELTSHIALITGFAKVYENYMVIFNESEQDKLTGLYNRRTFDNKLVKLFKNQCHRNDNYINSSEMSDRRHHEDDESSWLIITDIDYFKRINDTYGHVYGDEVILILSQKMKSCFRRSDLLFRVGGEEFVIILEPVSAHIAETLVDRFLKTISEHEFSEIGTVTVSAGYARIGEKDYPPAVLECADKALYFAKEHGRNCSYNYESLIENGKIIPPKKGGSVDLF